MRTGFVVSLLLGLLAIGGVTPSDVQGQDRPSIVIGGGVGATYYCIITRCNSGTTFAALVGYEFEGPFSVEGTARRLRCFDCNSFWMTEGSVRIESRAMRLRPSLTAGVGVISDSEFFGERKFGPHVGVGLSLPALAKLGVRLDVRGREVGFGTGDYMGEATILLLFRP
jgi:hypothetical protein